METAHSSAELRGQLTRWAFVLLLLGGASIGLVYLFPAPPDRVTFATAFKGTGFHYYGLKYRDMFARSGIDLNLRETAGALENVKLLLDPASGVQMGFVLGGVSDGDRTPGLLSLGTAYNVAFWIFYVLPEPIDSVTHLKGKRVAVGPVGSGIRATGEKVLKASGVSAQNTTLSPLGGEAAFGALEAGRVDAVWTTAPPELPDIQRLVRIPNVRLLSFKNAEALSRVFPELVRLDLPQGVLDIESNFPPSDTAVLATRVRVLVRNDIHPSILNVLLQTMQKLHAGSGVFQRAGDFPTGFDPEYQMADAAVEFFKSGPSVLHRHVPLWLTVHVQRAIVLAATLLPLLYLIISGEPQIYRWIIRERVRSSYRQLRGIERQLQSTSLQREQMELLRDQIETIDRRAGTLSIPGRYADSLFSLKVHINLVRGRLATKLQDLKQAM